MVIVQHFPNIFPTFWGLSQHLRLQKSHRRGAMRLHHTLRLWQVGPEKLQLANWRTSVMENHGKSWEKNWKIMGKKWEIGKQLLTWLQVTKMHEIYPNLDAWPLRIGQKLRIVHVDPKLGHPDAATGTTSRTIANVMCWGNPRVSYLYMICTCVHMQLHLLHGIQYYIYIYNHIYRYLCVPMLIIRSYLYMNLYACVPGCIYVYTLVYTCCIYICMYMDVVIHTLRVYIYTSYIYTVLYSQISIQIYIYI